MNNNAGKISMTNPTVILASGNPFYVTCMLTFAWACHGSNHPYHINYLTNRSWGFDKGGSIRCGCMGVFMEINTTMIFMLSLGCQDII